MAAIDAYLKKERKEMINDLVKVFSPINEKVDKAFVKLVYDSCYAALKEKTYVRERMSLAKVLAAKQIEDFIAAEMGGDVKEEPTPEPVEEPVNPADPEASVLRTKRRFIP